MTRGHLKKGQPVVEILSSPPTKFSFEFFPPKKPGAWDRLYKTISELADLKPAYVSVTYGAGGSTRENTHRLVTTIQRETSLTVVAHLTCVGHTREEVDEILLSYRREGVRNILALRGDEPRAADATSPVRPYFSYAVDLVEHIKTYYPEMTIGVAAFVEGHPATPNRLQEIEFLRAKVAAGADYLVTQLFFDNSDYYDFVERCRLAGITKPVVAGIMPITSRKGMEKMAELAAGARFPAQLLRSVARARTDEALRRVGVHWATEQVSNLVNHDAPGVHLYTLNASTATQEICRSLGLGTYAELASHTHAG